MAELGTPLALSIRPLDVATPLLQASRIRQQDMEAQQNQMNMRQQALGQEVRSLVPYANSPEFGDRWAQSFDRQLQQGLIDPQTHAQMRNSPSILALNSALARTDTPEMNLRRQDRDAEDQAYKGFLQTLPGTGPMPGASNNAIAAQTSALPAMSAGPPVTGPRPGGPVQSSATVMGDAEGERLGIYPPSSGMATPSPMAPAPQGPMAGGPARLAPSPGFAPASAQGTSATPMPPPAGGGVEGQVPSGLSPQIQRLLAVVANGRASEATRSAANAVLQRLLPETGKFEIVRETEDGRKIYGFTNGRAQTVNEYTPQGANGQSATSNLTGQAYLDTLDPGRASQIKAIVEGRMAPPSAAALRSPAVQSLMRAAAQYEPGFDSNIWTQRNATTRDFASGPSARNVTSLNTVIGHLDDLRAKSIALDNYRIPAANYVANAVSGATGDPRISGYRLAAKAVADELAKVFRQTGMSDSEIHQWHSALSENQSPAQMRETIGTAVHLLDSRLNALGDQRNRGFAHTVEPRSLLNPNAQQKLQQIEAWVQGGQPTRQAPAPPAQASPAQAAPQQSGPAPGAVVSGFRFRGGDPNNQASWEPAQ